MLSNGHILFQFGDTFTYDHDGNFSGLLSNTISVTTNPSLATRSWYRHKKDPAPVTTFIQPSPAETSNNAKIWSFSGIVEIPNETPDPNANGHDIIEGWVWYEFRHMEPAVRIPPYDYTGLAKVEYDPLTKRATSVRVKIGTDYTLFDANEPRFGSFAAIRDGNYIYLYGQVSETNKDVHAARVHLKAVTHRLGYQFWNGDTWCHDIKQSIPVMRDMQHGQVFKSPMFGKNSPYEWVMFGCNGQGDNRIQMGRAKEPEGPWEIEDIGVNTWFRRQRLPEDYSYCVYPHPWADRTHWTGMITISWSEGGRTGQVLMSKYCLKMEEYRERPPFFERKLGDVHDFVRNLLPGAPRGYIPL